MADPRHPRKFSEEFKRQVVQLYDNGKSASDIHTEYDPQLPAKLPLNRLLTRTKTT